MKVSAKCITTFNLYNVCSWDRTYDICVANTMLPIEPQEHNIWYAKIALVFFLYILPTDWRLGWKVEIRQKTNKRTELVIWGLSNLDGSRYCQNHVETSICILSIMSLTLSLGMGGFLQPKVPRVEENMVDKIICWSRYVDCCQRQWGEWVSFRGADQHIFEEMEAKHQTLLRAEQERLIFAYEMTK